MRRSAATKQHIFRLLANNNKQVKFPTLLDEGGIFQMEKVSVLQLGFQKGRGAFLSKGHFGRAVFCQKGTFERAGVSGMLPLTC